MLIDFSVSNFRSIRDEATLHMAANSGNELRDTNVAVPTTTEGVRPIPTVRTAVIYGANGAGKTNLIRALGAMQEIVLSSARGLDELPVVSFRFDEAMRDKPTKLQATIIGSDGVRYRFGFKATKKAVLEEWLYAWPRGRVQKWYVRHGEAFDFGERLVGDREVWSRATRPDALFLSTAIGLNSAQLRPVFDWFARHLHVGGVGGWSPTYTIECCDDRKEEVMRFLHSADVAISDLMVTKEDFSPAMIPEDMPASLRETLREDLKGAEVASVRLTHETGTGAKGDLELEEESDGTQKVFALAGPWIDALANGYLIVLDELHDNLHPNLVQFLVGCFHEPKLNRKGAQLVFSTHETTILSHEIFRRDQIWFCERDENLATSLYALSEFKPRPGVVNLERAYLSGRFGALPFTGVDALVTEIPAE